MIPCTRIPAFIDIVPLYDCTVDQWTIILTTQGVNNYLNTNNDYRGSIGMDIERRSEENLVHESLHEVLNETQLLTLSTVEEFGWVLAFIRRPLFQDIVPVLLHPDNNILGTLEVDGEVNTQSEIKFR